MAEPLATKLAAIIAQGQAPVLPANQELAYQIWRQKNNVPESSDYNMRGFYQSLALPSARGSAINPNDGQMHYPDTFKLPNHPTFSTDSGYYNPATMPQTPTWAGGPIGDTGQESWMLRRPNGQVVEREAPWVNKGYKKGLLSF
jgi:hypothetical protein